ncbi:hypothetical protein [Spirillospora sp. CA-294931]|uniref:hypothetical protein n=1 Tax=Spirillospora sp. CA-294931 TaxID=3240042 RepID=UPI003D8DCB1C
MTTTATTTTPPTATGGSASGGYDLAAVLFAIIATIALIRWALRPRTCRRCRGAGTVPGLLTRRPCPHCTR